MLNRDFTANKPDTVCCSDITYIWTQTWFVYLTSIMDLYLRKIITWEVLDTLHVDGIVSCINKVKKNRVLSNPIIIHSDRGSQYVSKVYRDSLGDNFIRSYSRKGNPWDNACIESFHALIKREWLNKYYFKDLMSVRRAIFEYIEVFYNHKRIHSTLGYQTPKQYEIRYRLSN
ncbi:IS3 family transposase [Erysipelothrix rhusiopathiae]|uniref:IS3 family transposase n=1 Tax=Erysipelothrix rhusiopathiae TaxID=1648 RepID=UPI000DA12B40|nr:IS3 family transposase [Erysipelothrix rhusiopathiae]MDV7678820.1 IS3 family transposase [Erysipelothrix rhusiopathiae]MDV7682273.1 IS3 family transposase [Erysipelothrix rhusiopathiae]MDV7683847.1 IS3 family transposase [Erysipelothrix rhusiopathiae]MDV7685711.1 IS3 family transposase [Erysipelothrix rhusiopathiae]